MMDDLISRQAAIDGFYEMASDIDHLCTVSDYVEYLESLPSAEPEQKTGKWEWVQLFSSVPYDSNTELGNWHCSECGFMPAAFNLAKKHLNYCPECGARMTGEEE